MLMCVLLGVGAVCAQTPGDGGAITAKLVSDRAAVKPGEKFSVGVLMDIAPGWHTYWMNPGDSGQATSVRWKLPDGWRAGAIQWPLPDRFQEPELTTYGYTKQVMLIVDITAASDAPIGQTITIEADVNWLECQRACVPGHAKLTLTLPVAEKETPANQGLVHTWRGRLPRSIAGEQSSPIASSNSTRIGVVTIHWSRPVDHVEVFPATTQAAELSQIKVTHADRTTRVMCQPTIYLPDQIEGNSARLLIVYHDAAVNRRGLYVPVTIRD
jgi:thiol:disulfide interchange protein DsbD